MLQTIAAGPYCPLPRGDGPDGPDVECGPFGPENLNRWTLPDSYFGAHWPDYFVFLGRHRDSDSLSRSNFECGLAAIGGESDTVQIVRESHWAVGWVEWIAIHESDESALEEADRIAAALFDYPVVDESHWSELEWEETTGFWESMSVRERADYCKSAGVSIFAARRAELPADDTGALFDMLRD